MTSSVYALEIFATEMTLIVCLEHYLKSVLSYHAAQNSAPDEQLFVLLVSSIQPSLKAFCAFVMFFQLHALSRICFTAH